MANNENLIPIPGRLHSVATEGHVAGADEIYDDNLGKLQSEVNASKADLVNGKVPSEQLPSYVDDVVNGYYYNGSFYKEAAHATVITGEEGKIYVDIPTDKSYRWSGSAYILISNPYSVDEEDLTVVNNNIKFKDRPSTDGMGKVILRKNMVNGTNTLTQSMMQTANTIYVIQYDFTLGGNITVPANCVLEFDGGSVNGAHTITGQNTIINADLIKIFNIDVTLAGTWNVAEAYPEWFGAVGDGVTDSRLAIQKSIDYFDTVKLCRTYNIGSFTDTTNHVCIKMRNGTSLIGSVNNLMGNTEGAIKVDNSINPAAIIYIARFSRLYNLSINGNSHGSAISNNYTENDGAHSIIDKVCACNFEYGINLHTYCLTVKDCVMNACSEKGYYIHNGTSVYMSGCYAHSCRKGGYDLSYLNYSCMEVCYGDHNGINRYDETDTAYYPVYHFYGNKGFTVNSIGAEDFALFIRCRMCRAFSLNNLMPEPTKLSAYCFEIDAYYGGSVNNVYVACNNIETVTNLLVIYGNLTVNNFYLNDGQLASINTMIPNGNNCIISYDVYKNNTIGNTANRPTPIYYNNNKVIYQYFDTDLGKYIYYQYGGWIDATGTQV